MTGARSERQRRHRAIDDAYKAGDMEALRVALGDPPDFPNCVQPAELAVGAYPLEYAIYWSPASFVEALLVAGADPDYPSEGGFPSLIAVLSSGRDDALALLETLIHAGADPNQRGVNDWTPLHYAIAQGDLKAVPLLLRLGADPDLATRIDDRTTPREDARALGLDRVLADMDAADARGRKSDR